MRTLGVILMLTASILAWHIYGGYTCSVLLAVGFVMFIIGLERNENDLE